MLANLLSVLDKAYKEGAPVPTKEALGFEGYIKLTWLDDDYYKVEVISEHAVFAFSNSNMFTIIDETKRYIKSYLLA